MPVDLPNAELFKPALPRAPRLHALFGSKNFRIHGFMEGEKWPPNALTDQYQNMVKMLGTHLHYKRLELQSDTHRKEEEFQNLKEQCRGGLTRLKTALSGDQLIIRALFSHNPTLQRLYSSMPLYAIVEHADDNTFRMRRKRDRLRYELQKTMDLYKQKLIEKSKLEDGIKFEKESLRISEELKIVNYRTEISTSETRVYALKAIQRAYKRMIGILKKDENYFEPVLKSLEEDVTEQEKFIKLTVMLGYPVVNEKEQNLRQQYQKMETEKNVKIKQNINLVDDFKKKSAKDNKTMISTVRKSIATIGPKNEYIRETKSMEHMRNQSEDLETVIKELQMLTTAEKPKDIYPRFKVTDMMLKEKGFKDKMHSIISGTVEPTRAQEIATKFNFTEEEQARLDEIKHLQEEIKKQQNTRKEEEEKIAHVGNILGMFQKSLYQILDILRHIDKPMDIVERKYPNAELKLPLLDFEAKLKKVSPPVHREDDVEEVMALVLEKIKMISQRLPKDNRINDAPSMLQQLRNKYVEIVETEDLKKLVDVEKQDEEEIRDYSHVPTRKQIKQQGMRIVEKALEQKELLGN